MTKAIKHNPGMSVEAHIETVLDIPASAAARHLENAHNVTITPGTSVADVYRMHRTLHGADVTR